MPGKGNAAFEPLSNLASVERTETPAVISHYDVQPVFDIYANVQDRDLGSLSGDIQKVVDEWTPKLPPGTPNPGAPGQSQG